VCFKVTEKSRVATRTAESRRVKTAQNSQRGKAATRYWWITAARYEGGGGEVLLWPWSIWWLSYSVRRVLNDRWNTNYLQLFVNVVQYVHPYLETHFTLFWISRSMSAVMDWQICSVQFHVVPNFLDSLYKILYELVALWNGSYCCSLSMCDASSSYSVECYDD
jgi:hypothetical protein